ncbi:hypothetical protein E2562_000754 [Oryza meyeriana var. granulata]|uniref:Uncharacterized protein n=1 Tax=Oryza meyeriana var. granulata TaxID=110450 RepID=A0A6G1DU53_9ORYZ|nr:hypothetical protein E2562_000754 [Oryza meyeriana var. granulata]
MVEELNRWPQIEVRHEGNEMCPALVIPLVCLSGKWLEMTVSGYTGGPCPYHVGAILTMWMSMNLKMTMNWAYNPHLATSCNTIT